MNFNTDSVLFFFLFIFPGAFSRIIKNKFAPDSQTVQECKSSLTETSEIIVVSVSVLLINLGLLSFIRKIKIINPQQLIDLFGDVSFLIMYIILTLIITIGFTIIIHYFNKKIFPFIINWYNKRVGKPLETPNLTLWESIFENKDIISDKTAPIIVSIEKEGQPLSRGELGLYSPPHVKTKELILKNSAYIEEFFEYDKSEEFENKFFPTTQFEYTDLDSGITIKVFDNKKYVANMNRVNESVTFSEGEQGLKK